jgi:predicted enzyme related to lactoylglutathione lyase
MIQGLRTVIYQVDDLAAAKDWYSSVLGFAPYFDEPFYVGFNVGGYELGLDPHGENVVKGNNAVAYWGVEDIQKVYRKLQELGAETVSEITSVGDRIEVAVFKDPFGNSSELLKIRILRSKNSFYF